MKTLLVRTGQAEGYSAAEEPYRENAGQTALYAHIERTGVRVAWHITAGEGGRKLAEGRTWTEDGAIVAATVAAHKPSLRGVRA